jgi:hypothetical protein
MTITEALAELKTVEKRISSKRTFVREYLFRLETLKDPFEKDGGSEKKVKEEMQAISDLETRAVSLRRAIQSANEQTIVDIGDTEMSIADWLVWRREVAPTRERFLSEMRQRLIGARDAVRKQNVNYGNNPVPDKPMDIIVNVDESQLSKDLENIGNILSQLDGQLSLKNATVMVAV